MSELFTQIANFYGGDSFLKASFTDVCFLASSVSQSIVSGASIEVRSFDGFVSRRKQIPQVSRLDTIVCLGRLASLLETKLKDAPPSEIEVLDRMQRSLAQVEGMTNV
ncbi:hypothetical protein NC981_21560 [Leptolyngbya sp. DQ-M1]|uniref:hypothetical protein n=1 Tax=Leptolyngbya sp. DQ-M1 TaxID=2933920 RepID=UPI0032983831